MENKTTLHFVDSSHRVRAEMARTGFALGHHSEVYSDIEELANHPPDSGVVVARDDFNNGGVPRAMNLLKASGVWLPVIAVDVEPATGRTVAAIKAGALDYLSLPLDQERFRVALDRSRQEAALVGEERRREVEARGRIEALSRREGEVLNLLADGMSNKEIARSLDISPRTVEIHRSNMMAKLGARHAAEAVRLMIEAKWAGTSTPGKLPAHPVMPTPQTMPVMPVMIGA